MDLKPDHKSPVLTDQVSLSKTRFGMPSCLTAYLTIPKWKALSGKVDDDHPSSRHDNASEKADVAYHAWQKDYPSALSSFEQIINYAKGKKVALFLDYDGTLSPIVDNPDHAYMSSAMRTAVKSAARYFPTAIISGRSRDKVCRFVGLPELYYAGSHGMDIVSPVRESKTVSNHLSYIKTTDKQLKETNLFQPASEFLPMIDEVFKALIGNTRDIIGSKVENNKFCVSVHYRLVDVMSWELVGQRVLDVLKNYPRLHLTYGRKVLEIRPIIEWNKGKAVEFLLESLGLNDRDDVLAIYIGDDRTDEDAFEFLKEGKKGYGILVSTVPKETNAHYSVRDPSQVMEFLRSLVWWKKSETTTHQYA